MTTEYYGGDEFAVDAWLTKYALRDDDEQYVEQTPEDTQRRLAREFARIEAKYSNPLSEDEIFALFDRWRFVLPQGSPMAGIGNDYLVQSLGNCFVVPSPKDSYGAIMRADEEVAQIQKRRGGVGLDLSNLRPRNARVKNAARTTAGIGAYLKRYSNTTREIGQDGRRGALMQTISCRHPEIQTFIDIKRDRKQVTGANISIKWHDDFLEAVEADQEYTLRWPVDASLEEAKITKVVRAKEIWDAFIDAAWDCAEPGALFWDTLIRESISDCYEADGYQTVSTNPCFVPGTLILTRNGAQPIEQLVGQSVEIWDGLRWVTCANFRVTGELTPTVRILFEDGTQEHVTDLHVCVLSSGARIEAQNLLAGMRLRNAEVPGVAARSGVVRSVVSAGITDRVYCCTVPSTSCVTLASGLLYGQCGELPLSAYDACRLMVVNLMGFVRAPYTKTAAFDYTAFGACVQKAQRLMDDLVDLELEAIDRILRKIANDPETSDLKHVEYQLWLRIRKAVTDGRRTGLGITALGDALAATGIKYGSEGAIAFTESVYRTLATHSERENTKLAKERGAFPVWSHTKEVDNRYLQRVHLAIDVDDPVFAKEYKKYGRRSISTTTTAPVGSISSQCLLLEEPGKPPIYNTTSGIEPVPVSLRITRRRKLTTEVTGQRVDFVDPSGDKWQEYEIYHPGLRAWQQVTGNTDITQSPYWGATSRDIDWDASVQLQAVAQKWISHSISKTCNLPESVTRDVVSRCYLKAWKAGCKGFTVYREGSRTGVIVDAAAKTAAVTTTRSTIAETHAPKRPPELACDVHHAAIKGQKWTVLVGLLDGKPYEVFAGLADKVELPRRIKTGMLIKRPKKVEGHSVYDLRAGAEADDDLVIKDIINQFNNPTEGAFTRVLSLSLRHGTPVQFVVEQLLRDKNSDVTSFAAAISRVLKKYIQDGASSASTKACTQCGASPLVYQEGCATCKACGWSKC